jgi:uncharacterized protein YjbI with pentapeptide repeats
MGQATQYLYDLLRKNNVEAFNEWRLRHPGIRISLCGLDLSYRILRGVLLFNAELEQVDFDGTILQRAVFSHSNLRQSTFRRGQFIRAIFGVPELVDTNYSEEITKHFSYPADLSKANFEYAVFVESNLREVNLSDADFTDASISESDLTGAQLHNVKLVRTHIQFTKLPDEIDEYDIEDVKGSAVLLRKKASPGSGKGALGKPSLGKKSTGNR